MTSDGPGDGPAPSSLGRASREDGPFVLRTLLNEVPLSADGSRDDIKINCVEYLNNNLYIGTSASELLHFVQIPPDPSDKNGQPVYILASRLCPAYSESSVGSASSKPGVQQILLLPRVGKACILCNWTVTFYSLPELSPVFGTTQVKNCNWIGGVDLNESIVDEPGTSKNTVAVILSLNRRIQLVRIGEEARAFRNIDFSGSIMSARRDSIACVANSKSYALVDVDRNLKIPLMSISSLDETTPPGEIGHVQNLTGDNGSGILRSSSSAQSRPLSVALGHGRSTSLGGAVLGGIRRQEPRGSESDESQRPSRSELSPSPKPVGEGSGAAVDKPLPAAPSPVGTPTQAANPRPKPGAVFLKPHISSPTPDEFLLVTGTSPLEPGIGMFVNLDGDPTRPTLEFERYPKEVVIDAPQTNLSSSTAALQPEEDGYVLASMSKEIEGQLRHGLEIQRLDAGSEANPRKFWLESGEDGLSGSYGMRPLIGSEEAKFDEIVERLCTRKFVPFWPSPEASISSLKTSDSRTALSIERLSKEKELFDQNLDSQDEDSLPEGWETARNAEGEDFARKLAKAEARLAVWNGNHIWWAIRNPLLNQLEATLEAACPEGYSNPSIFNRGAIFDMLDSIKGRDARTELEFMTFGYIRQKAGLLLLASFLQSAEDNQFPERDTKALDGILVDSGLDPRVVLSFIPGIRNEIVEGRRGIWIYGGVRKAADPYIRRPENHEYLTKSGVGKLGTEVMQFLRRFLSSWRKKKGFGSVADEQEVFRTVDAALLIVLLELDQHSPKGLGKGGAVRSDLNDLVDKGVECFDRAVDLLESYRRLFILSRLYQSRKLSGDVLATWKRIIEGERDDGQELRDGEQRVREYLTKISSQQLVEEYGVWLATRNPKLGVQVFAEDKSRVAKFEPVKVVELLKEQAPDAVKYYLEHLVFGKNNTAYVNDLIAHYLDVVVTDLESSAESRDMVTATYETYRALQAPKPAYRHFLKDNAPQDNEVWHNRLRLLQLLGGTQDYDASAISNRIAVLPDGLLVPETIILAGRAREHEKALRLLIHNLGDYDTAVSYCLRGGATIASPPSSAGSSGPAQLPPSEEQRHLFHVVLKELLVLEDASDRVEQTGALLERFGGWFDIDDVLGLIPDDWAVDIVAGFLMGALRRLVGERHETMLTRALGGAENLRVNYDYVVKSEEKGPTIEAPN